MGTEQKTTLTDELEIKNSFLSLIQEQVDSDLKGCEDLAAGLKADPPV